MVGLVGWGHLWICGLCGFSDMWITWICGFVAMGIQKLYLKLGSASHRAEYFTVLWWWPAVGCLRFFWKSKVNAPTRHQKQKYMLTIKELWIFQLECYLSPFSSQLCGSHSLRISDVYEKLFRFPLNFDPHTCAKSLLVTLFFTCTHHSWDGRTARQAQPRPHSPTFGIWSCGGKRYTWL